MKQPTFKAFLSHRYKSPEVNEYFYDLLVRHANVQFEVDVGTKTTNVTRLELLVRDSDAFVGFYPFPSEADDRPDLPAALEASRYFRLELDLAARSGRPTLVFVDGRYGTAITPPHTALERRYDHREIQGPAGERRRREFSDTVKAFCQQVEAARQLARAQMSAARDRVGILLPDRSTVPTGYPVHQIERVERTLRDRGVTPVRLAWRHPVDGAFLRTLGELDWMLTDLSEDSCTAGLAGFIHGYFVPQMRFVRPATPGEQLRPSPLEGTLLAPFQVGYPKDIVRCRDHDSFGRGFDQRLATLYEPRRYIGREEDAHDYFRGAALRNEAVFLSYSGEDRDLAAGLGVELRRRFQTVFDYRDQGESIVPGRRWLDVVFTKLSASALGVMLLSPSYIRSGNCTHEARDLVGLADQGKLRIVPVKIRQGDLELPPWLKDTQYLRGWEYPSVERLADRIVAAFDDRPKTPS